VTPFDALAVPFNSIDSYGTYFSARTDLALDLYPGGGALLYHHGLDPVVGLAPIGSWRVVDTTSAGVRIAGVISDGPHHDAIRTLMSERALGCSAGSAEHSMRIDARTGEIVTYPVFEISLSPSASNPDAVITAMRSADGRVTFLVSEIAVRVAPTPTVRIVASEPPRIRITETPRARVMPMEQARLLRIRTGLTDEYGR